VIATDNVSCSRIFELWRNRFKSNHEIEFFSRHTLC